METIQKSKSLTPAELFAMNADQLNSLQDEDGDIPQAESPAIDPLAPKPGVKNQFKGGGIRRRSAAAPAGVVESQAASAEPIKSKAVSQGQSKATNATASSTKANDTANAAGVTRSSAFGGGRRVKSPQEDAAKSVQSTQSVQDEMQDTQPEVSLGPSPAAVATNKKNLRDIQFANRQKEMIGQDAKIFLATLKVFAPLVEAVTFKPGNGGNFDEIKETTKILFAETEKVAKVICKEINVDFLDQDSQWIVSQARVIAAQHVGNKWKRHEGDEFNVDSYGDVMRELATLVKVEQEEGFYTELNDSVRVYLSLTKSIIPVIKEFSLYESYIASYLNDYQLDRKSLFINIAEQIQVKANEVCDLLNIPVDDRSRLIAYQAMLNHGGNIMASSVAYCTDRKIDYLEGLTPAERVKAIRNVDSDQGSAAVDVNSMACGFTSSMDALVELAKRAPEIFNRSPKMPKP